MELVRYRKVELSEERWATFRSNGNTMPTEWIPADADPDTLLDVIVVLNRNVKTARWST